MTIYRFISVRILGYTSWICFTYQFFNVERRVSEERAILERRRKDREEMHLHVKVAVSVHYALGAK